VKKDSGLFVIIALVLLVLFSRTQSVVETEEIVYGPVVTTSAGFTCPDAYQRCELRQTKSTGDLRPIDPIVVDTCNVGEQCSSYGTYAEYTGYGIGSSAPPSPPEIQSDSLLSMISSLFESIIGWIKYVIGWSSAPPVTLLASGELCSSDSECQSGSCVVSEELVMNSCEQPDKRAVCNYDSCKFEYWAGMTGSTPYITKTTYVSRGYSASVNCGGGYAIKVYANVSRCA